MIKNETLKVMITGHLGFVGSETTKQLDDAGITYVIGRQAQHDETFTVFANFNQYCDMSYMPAIVYNKIEYIEIDGLRYIHPDYILIDIFRMYNDPLTSYWRLPKVFKRMKLLMSEYKFDFKKAEELWAKAKGLVPADSEFARSMEENITAARAEASQKNTQKK